MVPSATLALLAISEMLELRKPPLLKTSMAACRIDCFLAVFFDMKNYQKK
jgi:hypothetical protein